MGSLPECLDGAPNPQVSGVRGFLGECHSPSLFAVRRHGSSSQEVNPYTGYNTGVIGASSPLSAEELRILLEQLPFPSEQIKEDIFNLQLPAGLRCTLITYGESEHLASLQVRAGFTGFSRVSTEHTNLWNRKYRFSKAYLDGDNDPVIENDLVLEGSSPQQILQFIRDFDDLAGLYFAFLRLVDSDIVP